MQLGVSLTLDKKLSIREISRVDQRVAEYRDQASGSEHHRAKICDAGAAKQTRSYADKLAGWPKIEAGRSRKQLRTVKQLDANLVALCFTGSYTRVAAFARGWRAERKRKQQKTGRGTFVPLHFDPDDAIHFEWAEDFAALAASAPSCRSPTSAVTQPRLFAALQTHEMPFNAHWHAFRAFGGVPARGRYANMRASVDCIGRGEERQITMRILAIMSHYAYAPQFGNPAAR